MSQHIKLQDSSDQVQEPATSPIPEGGLVGIEGLEGSPTHTPTNEGELQLVTEHYYEDIMDCFNEEDLIDWVGEVMSSSPLSSLVPSSSPVSPILFVTLKLPPSLPFPPPLISASSSALSLLVPESLTPPRFFRPLAAPWLLAPSSPPWPVIPLAPLGSLVLPAPPWSVVNHLLPRDFTPLASPRHFVLLAL
ncbi:7,8-didemethyl-8-hydroxy-5-deazariboflavin synthase [Labeo rohita]|uniref:7,8-didemethyl-8-hydroxy-5-deazariboflavin synthase n=1 Tax=Labeo rohita TaxID=84645 RepID=A0ABQ8LTH1_LABRO|nr:7,8-didemethyl-8-hydroxy-5-deazariboflavin synthase [Labeo rohita]